MKKMENSFCFKAVNFIQKMISSFPDMKLHHFSHDVTFQNGEVSILTSDSNLLTFITEFL